MSESRTAILEEQLDFYRQQLATVGDDPRSHSWRDGSIEQEQFSRLARLFDGEPHGLSVHEIGCGLAPFGDYLGVHYPHAVYSGSEICPEMVEHCQRRFPESTFLLRDVSDPVPEDRYDFLTLSGTFNNRLGASRQSWQQFVFDTLRSMYAMATKGIGVNFLTPYLAASERREELHYQSIPPLLAFVAGELSRHFELDAGGPLLEYTLRIYRPEYVRKAYRQSGFARFFPASAKAS